jgi:hypothetical protein
MHDMGVHGLGVGLHVKVACVHGRGMHGAVLHGVQCVGVHIMGRHSIKT